MSDGRKTITETPQADTSAALVRLPPAGDGVAPPKRKRKSGSEKRQRDGRSVMVRLLPEERVAVESKATEAGLSLGAYGRACMLGDAGPRARKRPPVERELLARANADLNRVGNNLNQIAHRMNSGDEVLRNAHAHMILELREVLVRIRQALGYDRQG